MVSAHAGTSNSGFWLAAGTSIGWGAGSHFTPFTLQIGMPLGTLAPFFPDNHSLSGGSRGSAA